MFGKTELLPIAVTVISLVAAATDLMSGKIYNWLTLPALLCGFAISFWYQGWSGLADSALGAGVGLLLYGWMFWLRVMGGGDVKLLMALGAWGGLAFTQETAILGVLLGGVFAAIWLALKGRLVAFVLKLRRFAMSMMVSELEVELPKIDRSLTMPFGIPIAVAAIWTVGAHPMLEWGFRPWS